MHCWACISLGSAVDTDQQILLRKRWSSRTEIANCLWELLALPLALEPTCAFNLAVWRAARTGLDRVGGCTEFMCRDVRDRRCLTLQRRRHGEPPRLDLLRRYWRHPPLHEPETFLSLRAPRREPVQSPDVVASQSVESLEEVNNMLGAGCSPQGQKMMIHIGERPATADGDKTGIAVLGRITASPSFLHLPNLFCVRL
jgi:hypothetical protein